MTACSTTTVESEIRNDLVLPFHLNSCLQENSCINTSDGLDIITGSGVDVKGPLGTIITTSVNPQLSKETELK